MSSVGSDVFLEQMPPTCIVKFVNELRILLKGSGGRYLLHTVAFPQSIGVTKGWDARFGRNACAG